jgi:5-(aminomethyl)-3-furanmethanol phosphate kinase
MRVVKLGGSLFDAPELSPWLCALAAHGAGEVVIVPGGGPFADGVRTAQQHRRFGDESAHRMALLGMAQFGLMLAGMEHKLALAEDEAQIAAALALRKTAIWLPVDTELTRNLPANWDFTSDSISAWLAKALGANALLLVKAAACGEGRYSLSLLETRKIVDAHFATTCRTGSSEVWLADRAGHSRFAAWMNKGGGYVRVEPD